MKKLDLTKTTSFDWDEGNQIKSEIKHGVSNKEGEEVFFNKPIFFFVDHQHSKTENRFLAYGKTNNQRFLAIVFTIRKAKIRIISARNMNQKERSKYEKLQKTA
ncbi:MAG TPA: BrnT family toxin [Patescibacteria group bacterium]|jgi:hypothetical protein